MPLVRLPVPYTFWFIPRIAPFARELTTTFINKKSTNILEPGGRHTHVYLPTMATIELDRRRPYVSPTHKGPVVNLIGWILIVTSVLGVSTVLISKLIVVRKLGWVDLVLTIALV